MLLDNRLEILPETKLAGIHLECSFSRNRTAELWQRFMPMYKSSKVWTDEFLFSVDLFPNTGFFASFDPEATFVKWAAACAQEGSLLPMGMETLVIPAGKYAVFGYRGTPQEAATDYRYILNEWIPGQGLVLDDRPHFASMGTRYRQGDPASEEELWFPVRD